MKIIKEVCLNCGYIKEFFPIDMQLRPIECPKCHKKSLVIIR